MMSSEVIDILFNPWLRALLGLCLIGVVFGGAMLVVWFERKLSGDIQFRLGPKYVGPFGLFQLVADAIKLMTKEDLIPQASGAGQDCTMTSQNVSGNTVSWAMKCSSSAGTSRSSGKITYSKNSFTGTFTTEIPQAKMKMKLNL